MTTATQHTIIALTNGSRDRKIERRDRKRGFFTDCLNLGQLSCGNGLPFNVLMHVPQQNSTRCKPEPTAVHDQHTSSEAKAFRYQYSSGAASAHCPVSLEPAKRCSLQGRRVFTSGTALTGCAQSVIPHKGTDFIHYIIILFSSMAGKWAKEIWWSPPGLGRPSAREGLRDLHRETATGPL